ncbi:MAG: dihydroorotate dehydrogenase electron transfer subunit [Treponema sp.]|nr:dihydroorotate dehydrogenase electron transfer subunit [Treponema sp.]
MIKPVRGSMFLPRPISVARWKPAESTERSKCSERSEPAGSEPAGTIGFLVALRGKGTNELSQITAGEKVELTGPLGNAWADFPVNRSGGKKVPALVGGGIGVAPLLALARELSENTAGAEQEELCGFDFYAGFRKDFAGEGLPEEVRAARRIVLAFEEEGGSPDSAGIHGKKGWADAAAGRSPGGRRGNFVASSSVSVHRGRIPDFVNPADHSAVYACGPEPMLKTLAARCRAAAVPCYVSVERRMACGAGACLGCTVETRNGSRKCCADGPIFSAEEIYFE